MKKIYIALSLIICMVILTQSSFAQSKITFQVDLRQQMRDSVFIPSQHSVVVIGNQLPFTKTSNFQLSDPSPVDSIYSATVHFPSRVIGNTLKYNFVIKREEGDVEEAQPRLLPIENRERKLRVDYFNQFAW